MVSDRIFRIVALLGGLLVLAVLALIAYSTTQKAWPWFKAEGVDAVFSDNWAPSKGHFGALGLMYGTLLVAAIALVMAVPVSVGIALFVNEVAPRRLRRPMVSVIDLLAAVPSVVFGLWGIYVLAQPLADIYGSVSDAFAGVPVLGDLAADPARDGKAFFTAGIIVAIMVTPIVTSITREVFATTPSAQKEGALALGATRWEMIRGAIFPHSRRGVVAAVIIGFGRAVGETIAVALLIGSANPQVTAKIFGPGNAMAGIIANEFGESSGTHQAALIGLGVVLLVMTFAVGVVARAVVARADRRLEIA